MARFVVGVPLILLLASVAVAQNPPQSNPQAVSLASQSIAALSGGKAINDVTLTGSVTWSAGPTPETGAATLLDRNRTDEQCSYTRRAALRVCHSRTASFHEYELLTNC